MWDVLDGGCVWGCRGGGIFCGLRTRSPILDLGTRFIHILLKVKSNSGLYYRIPLCEGNQSPFYF